MKNQKGVALVWIMLLIVLVVAGIYGFYYYRFQRNVQIAKALKKSQQISNWKTFSNNEWGVEFKYPQSHTPSYKGRHYTQKQSISGNPITGCPFPSDEFVSFEGVESRFYLAVLHKVPSIGDYFGGEVTTEKPRVKESDLAAKPYCGRGTKVEQDAIIDIKAWPYRKTIINFGDKVEIRYKTYTDKAYEIGLESYQIDPKDVDSVDAFLQQILNTFSFQHADP